ncbi:nitrophorin-2-like [Rhodnius prolixus]|uniref:Nitrophorin domain-containing protein n=1 Tax=Rhodnius prolixus TaxID=13249 RepID=T1H8M2_RHOPR
MEPYSALLAVTILCLTSTMGVSEECSKNISPKSGLDKEKYYSGTWYVTHYLDKDPQVTDKYCSSFAPRKDGNDVREALYHYKTNDKKKMYHVGEGTLESSGAKYTAKYSTVDSSEKELVAANEKNTYTVTVMEADDSSALIHICLKKNGEELGDLYTVLNRDKDTEPNEKVKSAVTQAGLQLSQFDGTKTLGCQYDDEFTS